MSKVEILGPGPWDYAQYIQAKSRSQRVPVSVDIHYIDIKLKVDLPLPVEREASDQRVRQDKG